MKVCASLQFNKANYLTTGYSRNLLLTMSIVDCLNSGHNLVSMFIFIDTRKTSSDVDYRLEEIVSALLPKLFRDAQFAKPATFSFNDSDKESGTMTLEGSVIPIRFIYNDDLTTGINKIEAMASYIQATGADLLLSTSNFSFWNRIGNDLNEVCVKLNIKLKILFVEGVNASIDKALFISSISDMSSIWNQLENDSEKYAVYSVGINDIFIKTLQAINDLASIKDLTTNNSFFELINTNPLEITSSGNNIVSSVPEIITALNGKVKKIKYLRTFATSLKNRGDKIIIKLNSIKIIDKQITKDSLNESVIKNFNETTSSWPKCEFVDRSVNVKEIDKLYFILTDTACEEIQTIQTNDKTIYEYNLRFVFETDSIMRLMSKLVLLIVNNFSKLVTIK